MKLSYLQVFTAAGLLAGSSFLSANQKDDLEIVDRLLEHYPKIDLTKEASYQAQLVAQKYNVDLAAVLNGKICYITNQKAKARQHFSAVGTMSEVFAESVMTYFELAADETIQDATGMKQASELFLENRLWTNYPDKESAEWKLVKRIFKAYEQFNRDDRTKMANLKKILKELDIDVDGEQESFVSDIEKKFINDWTETAGKDLPVKELEKILKKLEDIEFESRGDYEYFSAYPLRSRVLTMLGRVDEALSLLDLSKQRVFEFDEHLKEGLSTNKELSGDDRKQAFMQMSVLSRWYYAKGVTLFHKYRLKPAHETAADALFGKTGSVVNFYYAVKKYPENAYSFKSIIAYQKIRGIIKDKFSKNLQELTVSGLIQGKAFYSVEDFENAFKYLKEATTEKDANDSYDAYNLLIGTTVKLKKWEDSLSLFSEMVSKHAALNKAPKDHITKLANYLAAVYLKEGKDAGEEKAVTFENYALSVYKTAGIHGSQKSNISIKSVLANRILSKAASLKDDRKRAEALLGEVKFLTDSIIKDHSLSIESAKIYKTLGLTYHALGDFEKASSNIESYLSKIATFSTVPDESQLKMRLFFSELLLSRQKFAEVRKELAKLDELLSKSKLAKAAVSSIKENAAGVNVRMAFTETNKLPEEEAIKKYPEFIALAEAFIDKYQSSSSRPYIMAQVATLYQKMEQMDKANTIYTALQLEYPGHDAVEKTSINQVMVMINEREGIKALHLLAASEQLQKLSPKTLYSLLNQISDITDEYSQEDSRAVLKLLGKLERKELPKHADQTLALIEAGAMINVGQHQKAGELLQKVIEANPRGAYIIDLKLVYAKSLAEQGQFDGLSKVYASLVSLINGMNNGRGNANLTLKVSSHFSYLFSKANKQEYLKKGKTISFIASQYNPSIIDALSKVYLEESTYWNAWYSNKLNMDDFSELKKDFLRRYPSSVFAPELRKL